MTLYDPTPTYHDEVELADDSSAPTAGAFNPGLEGALDNIAYLKARIDPSKCVPVVTPFLADGSITIPANAFDHGLFEGCGGGSAGGVGAPSQGEQLILAGGGGGGGAMQRTGICPLVPGEVYDVSGIDGGGGTGTDGLVGIGNNGKDVVLTRRSTGDKIVICRAAQGGQPCNYLTPPGAFLSNTPLATGESDAPKNNFVFGRGGRPVRIETGDADLPPDPTQYAMLNKSFVPQMGGLGTCCTWLQKTAGDTNTFRGDDGNASPQGFKGGRGGTNGTSVLASLIGYLGGGAGGGGGAGPYGDGGAGGNGSAANASGASSAPTAGASAAANSGAGGGGGGGAGCASTTTTVGGAPGNGGSGRLYLVHFIPMPEPS
jgi:hypothetical protein